MINKRSRIEHLKHITSLFFAALLFLTMFPKFPIAKAKSAEHGKIIVSLGDSYSSGEGIEPFYGQDDSIPTKVKNPDWLAHRSENSWSGMLKLPDVSGTMSEHRNTNWYFAATSGATTENMLNPQNKPYHKYWGVYATGAPIPIIGSEDIDAQLDILNKLEANTADYVTLTLGGNDADFVGTIKEAVLGSTYLNTSNLANKINDTWKKFYAQGGIRDKLRKAYEDIADRAGPQAQIIVAGYPQLLEQSGKGLFFSYEEATIINNAVSDFNDAIERVIHYCKMSGINIHFVSVEEAFQGHEAYSDDSYINKVIIGTKSEDINNDDITSAYSMHPNYEGARKYAECVQAKIDELEEQANQVEVPERTTSDERDIVLVLDVSGSMAGTKMDETKKASTKFVQTILQEDASIGVVTYENSATMLTDFNINEDYLTTAIEGIGSGGGTNIEAGLKMAEEMLDSSNAEKKIIVLMSDGEPNDGKVGDSLISYADSIKDDGTYIYTLGFFDSLGSGTKSSAQILMEEIASDGCHYEVSDADNLVFFFGDIADQINGQKYIYIRIACPVDVTVTYNSETLCSVEDDESTRTTFGSLTFEENENKSVDGSDNRIKVLRLKDGTDYDIRIEGNGRGRMNYTIGFMDEYGEYSDMRKFTNISITRKTVIDTVATNSSATVLNVDEDGDGKYDLKYKAEANGRGKIVDYTYFIYIAIGAVVFIALMIIIVAIKKRFKEKKK